jgi:DNA-binding MarR family transcriptional regulator
MRQHQKHCPTCHQPVRHLRFGAYLSPRQIQVIDAIVAAGELGVSQQELANRLGITCSGVRSHVWLINEMFVSSNTRINSDRRGYTIFVDKAAASER